MEKKKYYGIIADAVDFTACDVLGGSAFSAGDWDDDGFNEPAW